MAQAKKGKSSRRSRDAEGVCELKIDFGPGYRVYYVERNGELIVLLAGGDKASQQQDVETALALARDL